jgi:hypothetical protein
MTIAYPESLPLEEIRNVISMLTGSKPADRAVVAKSVWVTTGYVLKLTVGEAAQVSALYVDEDRTDNTMIRDYGSHWAKMESFGHRHLSNDEAAAMLSTLVALDSASDEVTANFFGKEILGGLLNSEFIKGQIAKLLLPFLLNKLKEWILTGGLDNFLGDFIGANRATVSVQASSCCGGKPC